MTHDVAGDVGQSPAHSKDSKGVLKEKLDEVVAEVATKGMIGMQLAMQDGSSKHHEKVLEEATQMLLDLFTEVLTELLKDLEKEAVELWYDGNDKDRKLPKPVHAVPISECQRVIRGALK